MSDDDRHSPLPDDVPIPGLEPGIPADLRDHISLCRSCRARVIYAIHAINGRKNPIDPVPDPDGNVQLYPGRYVTYRVPPVSERSRLKGQLHVSHFVTCPDSNLHRSRRT